MKKLLLTTALIAFSGAAWADEGVSDETKDKIVAMLADMQCEMDTDDIEAEDGGYELDDVYCADGQYDIDLDGDLNVTNKRKE